MAALDATYRFARNLFGPLTVMLALAGQLTLGTLVPSAGATRDAAHAASVLCATEAHPEPAAP